MKFSCKTVEIVENVSNVQRAVATKSTISALEGILIRTKNDKIELCGYDLELGIKTYIPASIERQGCTVINAKIFSEIVRRLPEEEVTIEVDNGQVMTIKSGKSIFSIMTINHSDFPEIPQIEDANTTKLPGHLLKSMIKQTIFSISDEDVDLIHAGSLFELEKNRINIVSVDGYRLAVRTEEIENNEELKFVVPKKTLNEIIKLIPDGDDVEVIINVGKKHLLLSINEYQIFSRLLDGEFLDYKSSIPTNASTELIVNSKAFIESVERVALIIIDRTKCPLRCIFSDDEIKVSCMTNIGKATDELYAHIEGEELEIGFNSKYLLDALKNVDSEEVKIELNGSISPIKIMPKDKENLLYLILPVRLK